MRAKLIGCVFQSFHLLQGCTALENLLVAMSVGGNADYAKAKDLLSLVGMSEKENFLPSQLSVGQQQRVGIARALSNDPQLILADDATGSLGRKCFAIYRFTSIPMQTKRVVPSLRSVMTQV